ncbi:DUF4365 domain-containing protein [Mucilaginibacter sp. CAU 1740]|uniref:DUF4365 domain-containing protein n=1 Tax=Mucilaginibacter sp. CAU 1740 TaxID=3140365 RepID=UPI00325BAE16
MTYNCEERIGVHSIAKIFNEELRWIFREQSISDCGIDAYVEITRTGFKTGCFTPTGKLIAIQIKSGLSFFKEARADHFVFRGSKRHLDYWLEHCIPTILIIYDKVTGNAYWREVNRSTIVLTKKAFKVNIFKQNLLNRSSKEALTNIAFFSNKYQYKLWQIQSSIDEIKLLITTPLFLYIEIDEIPGSNSCNITLLVTDDGHTSFPEIIYTGNNNNANRFEYRFKLSKDSSLRQALSDTIPWADFFFGNEDFTDEILATTIADEISSFNQDEFSQDVLELRKQNIFFHLVCYLTGSYCFRLDLKANNLTYAFLEMERFLEKEPIVRTRVCY